MSQRGFGTFVSSVDQTVRRGFLELIRNIHDLTGRLTTAETDITALEAAVDMAATDIAASVTWHANVSAASRSFNVIQVGGIYVYQINFATTAPIAGPTTIVSNIPAAYRPTLQAIGAGFILGGSSNLYVFRVTSSGTFSIETSTALSANTYRLSCTGA